MWNCGNDSCHTVIICMFFPGVCRQGTTQHTLYS